MSEFLSSCLTKINCFVLTVFFCFCLCRLVEKINSSIGQDPESKYLIGVLDIYGFESFKTNRCLTGMPLFLLIFKSLKLITEFLTCLVLLHSPIKLL